MRDQRAPIAAVAVSLLSACAPSEGEANDLDPDRRLEDDLASYLDVHRRLGAAFCQARHAEDDETEYEACLRVDPLRAGSFPGPAGGCFESMAAQSRVWGAVFRELVACLQPHLQAFDICLRESPDANEACLSTYAAPADACVDTQAFDAMRDETVYCGRCDIDERKPVSYCMAVPGEAE